MRFQYLWFIRFLLIVVPYILVVPYNKTLAQVETPSSPQSPERHTINMREADLSALITLVSEVTKRNFIVDPRVQGKVTIIAPEPVAAEAIYRIFLNVLELNRYTIVTGKDADRIIPLQVAKELSDAESDGSFDRSKFVTRIIPIVESELNQIVSIIRPLLPNGSVLSIYEAGRFLILSDRESNIRRIQALVKQLDQRREINYEIISLKNVPVSNIVQILSSLDIVSAGSKLQAYEPGNALIISGPENFRIQVKELLEQLDQAPSQIQVTVVQLNYVEASKARGLLSEIFQSSDTTTQERTTIVADEDNNTLLISAPINVLQRIKTLISELDRRPAQILVEGIIFEMSADRFVSLGVQYGGIIPDILTGGVQFGTAGQASLTSLIASLVQGNIPNVSGVLLGTLSVDENGRPEAAGFLTALASDSSTNILSTPSLLTLDKKQAEIIVAQNVPFVTGRQVTSSDNTDPFESIQREDVGLTLRVTPHITADDTVRLELEQEISNLTPVSSAAGSEITSKREIKTNVLIKNERLILLGGLLEDQSTEAVQKVPFLGDIPILGYLFRSKSANQEKRILLLLLRATIIRTDQQALELTQQKYQNVRAQGESISQQQDQKWPNSKSTSLTSPTPSFTEFFEHRKDVLINEELMPSLPPRLIFDDP